MRPCTPAPLIVLVTLLAGCSGTWLHRTPPPVVVNVAAAEVENANNELAAGQTREAMAGYEAVVREHPGDPAAAEALHDLAMIRLEPGSPLRDRRAAQGLLRQLAKDYPDTRWGHEARAWRVLLRELDRCEVEATRRGADAEKLRQTLDAVKDSDLEVEHHQ
jgi:hypothetical protein